MRVRDTKPGWAWMRVDAQALPSGKGVFYLSQKAALTARLPQAPQAEGPQTLLAQYSIR